MYRLRSIYISYTQAKACQSKLVACLDYLGLKMNKQERRRGLRLETAILDAAWEELSANGYSGFTVEAVTKRAQTSRTVINRRWTNRAQLAAAAIEQFLSNHPVEVTDMGNIRDEMISLMRQYSDRGIPVIMLCALEMGEYYRETKSLPIDLRDKVLRDEEGPLRGILLRGVQREEIDGSKLKPRVISLPADLLRHEFLMTVKPPSDEAIAEVIDELFLPLVMSDKS